MAARRKPTAQRLSLPSACRALLLSLCLAGFTFAQPTQAQETAALDRVGPWKVINTAIFVVLLGWYLARKAPAFFNARSSDIQRAIKDATGLKLEADLRYSDIDRKMATLGEEVNRLRDQSRAEMEHEHERLRQQTQTEIERIRHSSDNEIEALRQEASNRVQARTAEIALGLAERRLSDRLVQADSADNIDDFLRLVERGNN